MKYNKISIFFLVYLFSLSPIQSLSALDDIQQVKGTLTIFAPEHIHLSPFWGFVWFESHMLSSLYRLGDGITLQNPQSYRVSRKRDNSLAGDATPALVHQFFGSNVDGNLEITRSKGSFARYLTPEMIADIIHGMNTGAFDNEENVATFIEQFQAKYPAKEHAQGDKVKQYNKLLRKLAKHIRLSIHETRNSHRYSEMTPFMILLSFLYARCSTKDDLWNYLHRLNELYAGHNIFSTDIFAADAQQTWFTDNFQDGQDRDILEELKIDVTNREATVNEVLTANDSYERFAYALVMRHFHAGPFPPIVVYKRIQFQSKIFPNLVNDALEFADCTEISILNLLNILFYDQESRSFQPDRVQFPLQLKGAQNFYSDYNPLQPPTGLHQEWAYLLASFDNIAYRRCIVTEDNIDVTHHPCPPLVIADNERLKLKKEDARQITDREGELFEISARTSNIVRILNKLFGRRWQSFSEACLALGFSEIGSKYEEKPEYDNNNTFTITTPSSHQFILTLSTRHSQIHVERAVSAQEAQEAAQTLAILPDVTEQPLFANTLKTLLLPLVPLRNSFPLMAERGQLQDMHRCLFSQDYSNFQKRLDTFTTLLHFLVEQTNKKQKHRRKIQGMLQQLCSSLMEQFLTISQQTTENHFYLEEALKAILSTQAFQFRTFRTYLKSNSFQTVYDPESFFVQKIRLKLFEYILENPVLCIGNIGEQLTDEYLFQLNHLNNDLKAKLLTRLFHLLRSPVVRKELADNPFLQDLIKVLSDQMLRPRIFVDAFKTFIYSQLYQYPECGVVGNAIMQQLDHTLQGANPSSCANIVNIMTHLNLRITKQNQRNYADFAHETFVGLAKAEKFKTLSMLLTKIISGKLYVENPLFVEVLIGAFDLYLPNQSARVQLLKELIKRIEGSANKVVRDVVTDLAGTLQDTKSFEIIAKAIFEKKSRLFLYMLGIIIDAQISKDNKLACIEWIVRKKVSLLLKLKFSIEGIEQELKTLLMKASEKANEPTRKAIQKVLKHYFSGE